MRLFEILILAGLSVTLLGGLLPRARRPTWLRYLGWLTPGLILLHFAVEHYRWQMVPAYVLAAVAALWSLRKPALAAHAPRPSWVRRAGRVLAVVCALLVVGLSGVLAVGFPVFVAPLPTGPLGIGTTRLFFVDSSRVDSFAPNANTPRELLATVWYPADVPSGAARDPFWPTDADAAQGAGLPPFMLSHVPLVAGNSSPDAPLAKAEARYPVILYSHGYGASNWTNVPQMEELASHGFIVVSLGHTYDASRLTFPDGRVVIGNAGTRVPPMKPDDARMIGARTAEMKAEKDPAAVRRAWKEVMALQNKAGWVVPGSGQVWIADTRYLIDQLSAIDAGTVRGVVGNADRFTGHMALDRLGLAGMSFGGSTTGSVCAIDPRCKAGVNLDGSQFGDVIDHPVQVPFLYFTSASNNEFPVYFGSPADLYEVHVKRSTHGNFTDLTLIMPLFTWLARFGVPFLGEIGTSEMERVMSAYSLAFFQKYLQGTTQPLLDATGASAAHPDVVFTAWPAGRAVVP